MTSMRMGKVLHEILDMSPPPTTEDVMAILRRANLVDHASVVLGALSAFSRGEDVPITGTVTGVATSDRSRNAFDNVAKSMSREGNLLAVVEQATELWTHDVPRRLRCVWAELMGRTGELTLAMLERADVLAPGGFVGIDTDLATIEDLRQRRPNYNWIGGDLLDVLRSKELEDVGVLNFDAYDMVGARSVRARARLIADMARRSVERFNAFFLAWNADLDATRLHGIRASEGLRLHANVLADALGGAVSSRHRLGVEELLPADTIVVDDPGWVGRVGHFEVYRGKSSGHRMANMRIVIR